MPEQHECLQTERFVRLEQANTTTASELSKINNTLVRIETTLSGKVVVYDKHVDDGEKWRGTVMFWLITTLVLSLAGTAGVACGYGIWMGKIENQVNVNTARWDRLLSHEKTQ